MSSGSSDKVIVRYAPYIEDHHQQFLGDLVGYRKAVVDESPYGDYKTVGVLSLALVM